jgi:protein gp37
MHDRGQTTMRVNHHDVPVPRWVFFCSLSDFFDNEWPPGVRDRAWAMIRDCPALRPQIVTKRVGNVAKMLPADWGDGSSYRHVGIIATAVTQQEYDRDAPKLLALKFDHGVRWVGWSFEPLLESVTLRSTEHPFASCWDWAIVGGESKQGDHEARRFIVEWSIDLERECREAGVPYFRKQLGDHATFNGTRLHGLGQGGTDPDKWPASWRVQQMPTVFNNDPPYQPRNLPKANQRAVNEPGLL